MAGTQCGWMPLVFVAGDFEDGEEGLLAKGQRVQAARKQSAVDFSTVANVCNGYSPAGIINFIEDAVIAEPNTPPFASSQFLASAGPRIRS